MTEAIQTFIRREILIREGFTPVVKSARTYNIICVTTRDTLKNRQEFHLPIKGTAEVKQVSFTRDDIVISHSIVVWQGQEYDLTYWRNGLGGVALVIGIHNEDESPFNEWDLYTDTPSICPNPRDTMVTAEELRERAKGAIAIQESRRQWRRL